MAAILFLALENMAVGLFKEYEPNTLTAFLGMAFSMSMSFWLRLFYCLGKLPFSGSFNVISRFSRSMSFRCSPMASPDGIAVARADSDNVETSHSLTEKVSPSHSKISLYT